jgi:hypothetical protein
MGQIRPEVLQRGHDPWPKMAYEARANRRRGARPHVVTAHTARAVARSVASRRWTERGEASWYSAGGEVCRRRARR